MVSKKSKIFFLVVFFIFFLSTVYTYYDTMILGAFEVFTSEEDIPYGLDLLDKLKNIIRPYV